MYRGTKQNNKEHLQTGELMRFIWIYLLNGCVQMEMVSWYTDDEPLFLKNIGYCVQFFRKKSGMSQEELAEKSSLSYSTSSHIQSSAAYPMSIVALYRIADALGVAPYQL